MKSSASGPHVTRTLLTAMNCIIVYFHRENKDIVARNESLPAKMDSETSFKGLTGVVDDYGGFAISMYFCLASKILTILSES